MTVLMIIGGIVGGYTLLANLLVAHTMTRAEMREEFVTRQRSTLARIGCNLFYGLAWAIRTVNPSQGKQFFNRQSAQSL